MRNEHDEKTCLECQLVSKIGDGEARLAKALRARAAGERDDDRLSDLGMATSRRLICWLNAVTLLEESDLVPDYVPPEGRRGWASYRLLVGLLEAAGLPPCELSDRITPNHAIRILRPLGQDQVCEAVEVALKGLDRATV